MKYIVAGGRDFNNYNLVCAICNSLRKVSMYGAPKERNLSEIVCGDARGADALGARYGEEHDIPVTHFPAKWNEYGKSAGYIRNAEMADYADAAICFWDGKSKGTKHMIDTMRRLGKGCGVFDYEGNHMEWW